MRIGLKLALRDWDNLTPLALSDVGSDRLEIEVSRTDMPPLDLGADDYFDASEISLSRYATAVSKGRNDVFGVPNFLMRGFRHRCAITLVEHNIRRFEDLKGCRIGVTGWQDSGNIWTRQAILNAGVGIKDVHWFVGRLTDAHPVVDRLAGFGRPGHIEAIPDETSMTELLEDGALDAILTPFMPHGFFSRGSKFRFVFSDVKRTEMAYFNQVGYVPGHHILGIKASLVEQHPWLPQELCDLLDKSRMLWSEKRQKFAETSPWFIEDVAFCAKNLPGNWDESGLQANHQMIAGFLEAMNAQGICQTRLTPEMLFPTVDDFLNTQVSARVM